ncbi:hypothetical protein ACWEPL_16525 [Nonomuraea sp. NPDC004186]
MARAEEILPLNIEDLDFAGRRALVKAKGARSKARRRGQAREDFVLEPTPFIPADGDQPWDFTARQFRRTLAWHIAHQPFGVVAGARQYHHAKLAMFEGYAGTSASGSAAEEAVAMLDYVEDLTGIGTTAPAPAAARPGGSTASSSACVANSATCPASCRTSPGCAPCWST